MNGSCWPIALQPALSLRWFLARYWIGLLLAMGCLGGGALAQQAVPALTGHVVDSTGSLNTAQVQSLEDSLSAFEQSKGSQVVVLLIASSQPEDISSYANRVANTWKIGRKGVGDGVLIIAALKDHKLRIEVAKSLEGAIPDLAARRVIDEAIAPHFKKGDVAGGLQAGTQRLMALISGEALPAPEPVAEVFSPALGFDWMQLGVFMLMAVPLVGALTKRVLGHKLGALATGGIAGALAMTLTASLWIAGVAGVLALFFTLLQGQRGQGIGSGVSGSHWGHGGSGGGGFDFGSGSGSGGDFSSGGGGDFGGGGASGDW